MVTFIRELGKKITEQNGNLDVYNAFNSYCFAFKNLPDSFGTGANFPSRINAGDQATVFDLTGFHPHHEIPAGLTFIQTIVGPVNFTVIHRWFRGVTLLFTSSKSFSVGAETVDAVVFSVIGYVDGEIDVNATDYKFEHEVTGDITHGPTSTIFSVTNLTAISTFTHIGEEGTIWVDETDNKIHFLDGVKGVEHKLRLGPTLPQTSAPGQIYIDTSTANKRLGYISSNLKIFTENFFEKQRPTKTGTQGFWYIPTAASDNVGDSLSFIGNDGKQYIGSDGTADDF